MQAGDYNPGALSTLEGAAVADRFVELTGFLSSASEIWKPRPFILDELPWEEEFGGLASWLRRLEEGQVDQLSIEIMNGRSLAGFPGAPPELVRLQDEALSLTALGAVGGAEVSAALLPRQGELRRSVPGRKWRQVEYFAAAVMELLPDDVVRVVDWCAGKGCLGRTVSFLSGLPALLLERREALREQALEAATRSGANCSFTPLDVFDDQAALLLGEDTAVVGLHACGSLTDELLEKCVSRKVRSLAVSSCCYNKLREGSSYRPLSARGREAGLGLDRHGLRLACQDEWVASPRERGSRRRELAWRLGLDLLVRREKSTQRYTTQGALPRRYFDFSFGDFCRRVSAEASLELPVSWDEAIAERAGRERALQARGLGIFRSLFRRPLEVWIALDRALFIEEAGRPARVGTFCPPSVTPRNLLISSVS